MMIMTLAFHAVVVPAPNPVVAKPKPAPKPKFTPTPGIFFASLLNDFPINIVGPTLRN